MGHQQQPLLAIAQLHQHCLEQRPLTQLKTALGRFAYGADRLGPVQGQALQQPGGVGAMTGAPLPVQLPELQAQSIVVGEQRGQCLIQSSRLQAVQRAQQ